MSLSHVVPDPDLDRALPLVVMVAMLYGEQGAARVCLTVHSQFMLTPNSSHFASKSNTVISVELLADMGIGVLRAR
jgi:hypothetical protein